MCELIVNHEQLLNRQVHHPYDSYTQMSACVYVCVEYYVSALKLVNRLRLRVTFVWQTLSLTFDFHAFAYVH